MSKVSELTGTELDYWVAKAQGWGGPFGNAATRAPEQFYWTRDGGLFDSKDRQFNYTPSTNGGQCFELQQLPSFYWSQTCDVRVDTGDTFVAKFEGCKVPFNYGPTLNIAICRAFVASVYGEEVNE